MISLKIIRGVVLVTTEDITFLTADNKMTKSNNKIIKYNTNYVQKSFCTV